MAKINATLKINENGNGVLESFYSNYHANNVSYSPYSHELLNFIDHTTVDNKTYGASGTMLGLTSTIANLRFGVVDNNGVRSEKYNGMILGYTDENSQLNFTLTITGQDIIYFKIIFDNTFHNYPVDYSWVDIDGVTHIVRNNVSNEIEFSQRAGYGTMTITFDIWSQNDTMAGIIFIENIEIDVFLDKSNIVNFETETQKTSDASTLQYGVLANTGQILLKDTEERKLFRYANLGYLNMNLFSLDLFINNKLIQSHISNQSPYFTENSQIQLNLTNIIEQWDAITIPEIEYDYSVTLWKVFYDVMVAYDSTLTTPDLYEMADGYLIDFDDATTSVRVFMSRISLQPFTLKEDSFLKQLKKICTVGMLNMYITDDGKIKIVSARPLRSKLDAVEGKKIIQIPYKYQTKALEYDILFLNRYEEIEIK